MELSSSQRPYRLIHKARLFITINAFRLPVEELEVCEVKGACEAV
jgi:hypothetical protein